MRRRDDRNNSNPILRDLVRGTGGLGSGWFDMTGSDTIHYDYTSDVLGTESGDPLTTEVDTPIAK